MTRSGHRCSERQQKTGGFTSSSSSSRFASPIQLYQRRPHCSFYLFPFLSSFSLPIFIHSLIQIFSLSSRFPYYFPMFLIFFPNLAPFDSFRVLPFRVLLQSFSDKVSVSNLYSHSIRPFPSSLFSIICLVIVLLPVIELCNFTLVVMRHSIIFSKQIGLWPNLI